MNAPEPTPGSAALPPDVSVAGHHLVGAEPPAVPDYELIRRIGGGAYGDVWLARSTTGVLRAVKIVWRHKFEDERPFQREFEGIQRFERLSREHPSQLALFHIGRNGQAGYFYYVMELADDVPSQRSDGLLESWSNGPRPTTHHSITPPLQDPDSYSPHTLRADLAQGRLPAARVLEIGLALTEALSHLHNHGLVHRDVKPSNVIFVNGRPKLADIGLVTDTGDTRSIVGTEGYLAPEGPGTPRADLFALGKVLYEAATGLDRQQLPQLPPDLRDWPDAKGVLELNEVLLKACARDAQQRYQSAEEMRDDLALLQRGQSVRRLRTLERRVAVLTKAGLVATALLVTAAVAYLFAVTQARRTEREKHNVERLLYASDMNVAQQALEAGNLVRAIALLEAHRPKPGGEDLRGFEWYYLKNLCRGDEAYTFSGHERGVRGVAISPDGRLFASCSEDRTIRLWDFASKTNVATLRGHTDAVNAITFSPDGARLASGGEDKTVKLWDVATREIVARFTNHAAAVTSVAFSSDGRRLAVGTDGDTAKLWEIATGQELREFDAPDNAALLVSVSPDGRWLAIGGSGFIMRLWEVATLQPAADLYEEAGHANGIAFSPDSRILATTRSDGIYLWDIAAHRVVGKLKGHEAEVHPVAFSPDGKTLASGSIDSTVRLWDLSSRQPIRIFKGHKEWVRAVAFSPDGQQLISAGMDQEVKLWELSPKDTPDILRGHTDAVQSVAFSPDDKLLATASLDGTVKLWDVASGTNIATFTGHGAGVTGVAILRDGATLVSCSLDKTVRFWNVTTGQQLATFPGGKKVSCLALSPDGNTIAVGSGWWDELSQVVPAIVSFWDLASREPLTNHVIVHDMVQTLSFSPDGKTLAVCTAEGALELVDMASKTSFFSSTNLSSQVAWSPQDGTLAVSDDLDWIGLFDITKRQISRRLQMPSAATRYAACSPDGRTMAFFYTTTRIKLCNVATGREVATLQGHEGFGMHLAFSHDGQTLATAGNDRTVRLWRAPRNNAAATEHIAANAK